MAIYGGKIIATIKSNRSVVWLRVSRGRICPLKKELHLLLNLDWPCYLTDCMLNFYPRGVFSMSFPARAFICFEVTTPVGQVVMWVPLKYWQFSVGGCPYIWCPSSQQSMRQCLVWCWRCRPQLSWPVAALPWQKPSKTNTSNSQEAFTMARYWSKQYSLPYSCKIAACVSLLKQTARLQCVSCEVCVSVSTS